MTETLRVQEDEPDTEVVIVELDVNDIEAVTVGVILNEREFDWDDVSDLDNEPDCELELLWLEEVETLDVQGWVSVTV